MSCLAKDVMQLIRIDAWYRPRGGSRSSLLGQPAADPGEGTNTEIDVDRRLEDVGLILDRGVFAVKLRNPLRCPIVPLGLLLCSFDAC